MKKIRFSNKKLLKDDHKNQTPAPVFVPIQIKEMDFEYFLREMERKFPNSVKYIRQIYSNRFALLGDVKLGTTEEKLALVNEFLDKFKFPLLSSKDADIAYHEGGDEVFFEEKLVPIFSDLEDQLL